MRNQAEAGWQDALKIGLAGGGAAVLLALIGMVEVFAARGVITGVLSLGQALLLVVIFASAFAAARRAQNAGQSTVAAGAIAGAVVGALLAFLVILGDQIDLRRVFINASDPLYNILAFGRGPYQGAVLLIVVGALLGALTGALLLLSPGVRGTILMALAYVLTIGLLSDLLRLIIIGWGPIGGLFLWLFAGRALSIVGALAIAAVVVVFSVLRQRGIINFRPRVAPASGRN